METLRYWFTFVNNDPASTRKLALIIFGCGWPEFEWILQFDVREKAQHREISIAVPL